MMKAILQYTSLDEKIEKLPIKIFVTYSYQMFPEFDDEFDRNIYDGEHEIEMEQINYEGERNEFELELEMPYGNFKA
jgi:hypothetical protein